MANKTEIEIEIGQPSLNEVWHVIVCPDSWKKKPTKCKNTALKCQIHTKTFTRQFPIISNMTDLHFLMSHANILLEAAIF